MGLLRPLRKADLDFPCMQALWDQQGFRMEKNGITYGTSYGSSKEFK